MTTQNKNITILIAAHKPCKFPKDSIYLPIQVGKELHKELDLGITPDNTGDNISALNSYYCELTAIYWAWKNLSSDYVGLVHYRRYLSLKKKKDKFSSILSSEEASRLCERYDIVLPQKRRYFIETIRSHYAHTHDGSQLDKTRIIIERLSPSYVSAFDKVMKRTWAHVFNMFIFKWDYFEEYCSWLFPILTQLRKEIDTSKMSSFDARYLGRISELLLDVWIEGNHLKYHEIGLIQLGKENWPKKIYGFLMAKFFNKKYNASK